MALASGTTLRQYEILEPIGAGGMGEVYRARDSRLGRDVAIKVLPEHLSGDPQVRARFDREARAIAALSHPNLLSIHEFTLAGDTPFAVMELLEGETLRARLSAGPLPWKRALEIAQSVAEGLAAAHAKGIIHRDLKPENIFLTRHGVVKILDFGLASRAAGVGASAAVTTVETVSGMVLGTFGYIAPEQLQGLGCDGRSDVFSLGCVLYEMLTGRLPFAAGTAQETIAATLRDPVPPLPVLDPPAPPELARIVDHCLARPLERRFGSARDLALALQAILQGSGPVPLLPGRRKGVRGKSIAVLPFENPASHPATEYLADGLTESIINMLSQLPGIRVVPRTSVFRYKGVTVDPGTVALALNARTLLTGRLSPRGDAMHIQAELIDAATESQIWGEQYRRPISDLQALQEEIAWHISEALRIKLTGQQKKKLHRQTTASSEAYQEYLRGRFEWNKWTPVGFRNAVDHFQRAIEVDANFALGWAGLGDAYGALSYYHFMPPREGFPRAEAAARRALEIDPQLAEAHLTLAVGRLFYGWNTAEAEKSFKRAIQLKPTLALAHSFYAFCLWAQDRLPEALEEAREGLALDPLSLPANMTLGWVLLRMRAFEEVVAQGRRTLALDPAYMEGHVITAAGLELLERHADAARHFAGVMQCFGVPADVAIPAQDRLDPSTAQSYWESKLAVLSELAETHHVLQQFFIAAYVALGRADRALDLIEGLVEEHSGSVIFIAGDPVLVPLRDHPRFKALLKRIGLT
ncbi:MAG TPA: protein kinase [Vicinamibacterales bacterium]|nr:protein kinase [Vicinamibacterales bacterium]